MADGVRINPEVHEKLLEHILRSDRKIGRFVEIAILEKIEREKKQNAKTTRGRQKSND